MSYVWFNWVHHHRGIFQWGNCGEELEERGASQEPPMIWITKSPDLLWILHQISLVMAVFLLDTDISAKSLHPLCKCNRSPLRESRVSKHTGVKKQRCFCSHQSQFWTSTQTDLQISRQRSLDLSSSRYRGSIQKLGLKQPTPRCLFWPAAPLEVDGKFFFMNQAKVQQVFSAFMIG